MRLYRLLRAAGAAALAGAAWLAHHGLPELTAPETLRIAGAAVPALALLLLGRALKRAQKVPPAVG